MRHQRVVVRLLRQERLMRALLQEAALAEDADLRRGPDRRQPVRDHQRRARRRGHELVEGGLHDLLGLGV